MTDARGNTNPLTLGGEIGTYDGPATLKELFERQVRRTPGNVALEDAPGTRSLTYAELDKEAQQLCRLLHRRHGVCPGVCVGLATDRSVETMIAMLAILKAGGTYVPLGTRLPEKRLGAMIRETAPAVIVCGKADEDCFAFLDSVPVEIVEAAGTGKTDDERAGEFMEAEPPPPSSADLAYIIFTSGTTGTPKGVMIPHSAVVRYIDAMAAIVPLTENERVLQIMELTFDSSIFDIWMAWSFGGTLVLCEQWTALDGLAEFIRSRGITCLGCTPTQLGVMSPEEVPHLRVAAIGGEAVPPPLIREWARHPSCQVFNQYGPTEATVTVTSIRCSADMPHPTSIGHANPGSAKLYILDARGQAAAIGEPGELCISGPQLATGYLNRERLTAEKFVRNPFSTSPETDRIYRSGDRCRWLPDGSVEYLGRLDSQVKLRGFRIELDEIEHHALEFDSVRACAVALHDHNGSGRSAHLCAYVVPRRQDREIDLPRLRAHLAERLPDHMVPAAFMKVTSIPTDSSGKTDRSRLPRPEPNHFIVTGTADSATSGDRRQGAREPLSDVQNEVAALVAEVLETTPDQVGLHDNFFSLGGQSLTAARLLGLIRRQFGIHLRFADFFKSPTPAFISARVESSPVTDAGDYALGPRNPGQGPVLPLSSAQSRIYFLDRLDPDASVYNVCAIYQISGGVLDPARLELAFRSVIERHEILRSSYQHRPDGLFQIVEEEFEFTLARLDLRDAGFEADRLRRADEAISATSRAPFDLDKPAGVLIRALLIRLDTQQSRLAIIAHHVAVDGLSWDILCAEISTAYAGSDMPPLTLQYGDFCLWESRFLRSQAYRDQLAYWRRQLDEELPPLELPSDRLRPAVRSGGGASLTRTIEALAAPLKRASAIRASTPFSILLAAYFTLLNRLTGRGDLIVGILSSGRSQLKTAPLVGMFVNTLPIRIKLEPDLAFSGLLDRVNVAIHDAFDHQDVPFEEIVRQSVRSRDPSHMPLVQTMLTMDAYGDSQGDVGGLTFEGFTVSELEAEGDATSMFDYSVGCSIGSGPDLVIEAEYSTDLFDECRVAEMLAQFEDILRAALADPDIVLCDMSRMNSGKRIEGVPVPGDAARAAIDPPESAVRAAGGDGEPVEARTTEETRLCAMFCEVLGLPKVGIHDGFFELGGDSLLSFRLVALARSFGYYLNVNHVLDYQTVAELARFLLSAASLESAVEPPAECPRPGEVPLTPIQRWFFQENFPVPSHYNQSRMFRVHPVTGEAVLREALFELIQHHDALRLTFESDGAAIRQVQHEASSAPRFLQFSVADLTGVSPGDLPTRVETAAKTAQTSLDISRGPMVAATLIRRPGELPQLLFVVIHHLAVDEVSWSIIEDDLERSCRHLADGRKVSLPPKSHSFAQWSSALVAYAESRQLEAEIPYWRNAESSSFELPGCSAPAEGNQFAAPREAVIEWSAELGRLEELPQAIPVRDLLIAALAWSIARDPDCDGEVCLMLEGHGREPVVAEGFDISRTVGWFTSAYPVRFELKDSPDSIGALRKVAEYLNAVPRNGIGYGLLRYHPHGRARLSRKTHASPITFNYLGRSASPVPPAENPDSKPPRLLYTETETELPEASDWDPRNQSADSMLDISCHVNGTRLEMSWRFDAALVDPQVVDRLVAACRRNLDAMVSSLRASRIDFGDFSIVPVRDRFQRAMESLWEKHRPHDSFHGLAASVVIGGETAFAGGFGFRDQSRSVPVDSHTRFSLGSVGKPFVSLLGAVLADEGIVDLDEALAPTLAKAKLGLPQIYERMTLRQLFCMTAGIPFVDACVEENFDDIFEACRSEIEIEHEPGASYYYSNFSYALAGYILALRAGDAEEADEHEQLPMRFGRLLREKVFEPVGMADARVESWKFMARDGAVLDSAHNRSAVGSAMMLPSGAVRASASDAAAFLNTEFNRGLSPSGTRVASMESVEERFDVSGSLGYDWGMGWFRDRTQGFLHISGQWADAVSGMRLDPVTGLGMSFIVSVRDSVHWQFMEMDVDRAFIDLLEEVRRT